MAEEEIHYPLIHQEITSKTVKKKWRSSTTVEMWKTVALYPGHLVVVHNKVGATPPPLPLQVDYDSDLSKYDQAGSPLIISDSDLRITAYQVTHSVLGQVRFVGSRGSLSCTVRGAAAQTWIDELRDRLGDRLLIRSQPLILALGESRGGGLAVCAAIAVFVIAIICAYVGREMNGDRSDSFINSCFGYLGFGIGAAVLGALPFIAFAAVMRDEFVLLWANATLPQRRWRADREARALKRRVACGRSPFRSEALGRWLRWSAASLVFAGFCAYGVVPQFHRLPDQVRMGIYMALGIAVYYLRRFSQRIAARSAADAMQTDSRPPILFLRSFIADQQPKIEHVFDPGW